MTPIFEELSWRGFVEQVSDPALGEKLQKDKVTLYVGFDPTASSLQVGNLVSILALSHFQRHGHRPIALIGGATGMIGDPSGRSKERNLLTEEEVEANADCFKSQMERFLQFGNAPGGALMLNNAQWLIPYRLVHFMRDIGKYFRIGDMLAKESVRARMDREEGISYTEFSYMLMQAYDFLYLFEHENCTLQMGGNDQWGNITAGIELIRRLRSHPAYGMTTPLVTSSSGEKLGKTAEGTIWLDPGKTSPYEFYQFWIRAEDRDAVKYLKMFTYLGREEICALEQTLQDKPDLREAQKKLAFEVTALVHGREEAEKAVKAAQVLYGEEIVGLTDRELEQIFADVPSTQMDSASLDSGVKLLEALTATGLCESKGAAKKLISQGGVYINNRRETSVDRIIRREDLASGRIVILRTGKKNYHLVRFN